MGNVPEFLRRRTEAIDEKHKSQIEIIQGTMLLVNNIIHGLPSVYTNRKGCNVNNAMGILSGHDAARSMGMLLITEFSEILVNLYSGAHNSARRNVRSPLEWMIRVLAAVSDRRIFTKELQDANRAVCFEELREAIKWGGLRRRKIINKKYIEGWEVLPGDDPEKAILFRNLLANASIPDGIKGIPEKLNDKIMSNLRIRGATLEMEGAERLYVIYGELSQSVHNAINKLDRMHHDGLTPFFDPESFDESYFLIHAATDIILCFYFILLDIDVFHALNRQLYRKSIKNLFAEIFDEREFSVCRTLFDGEVWNDPLLEFTCQSTPPRTSGKDAPTGSDD